MDLRMVKTRSRLRDAFLALREKKMPDKIRVKDICDLANVNKTTFYNHYTDTGELSNEIDETAIDMVLSDFSQKDQLLKNPSDFIHGLLVALERESSNLKRVFRGKQDVFCVKLEERLYDVCHEKVDTPEEKVRLSFAIGGFSRLIKDYLIANPKYDIHQLADATTRLLETLMMQ